MKTNNKLFVLGVLVMALSMILVPQILIAVDELDWKGILPGISTEAGGTYGINVAMIQSTVGLDVSEESSATNTVYEIASLTHETSGTAANGIGTRLTFTQETAASNNEDGLTLDAVTTDVTAASEDFDLVINLMDGGTAAAERWRLDSGGVITQSAESAATNAVVDIMSLKHGTSGTEANGIGMGITFTQEVTSGDEIAANLDVVATDVTAASEDFSFIWSLMKAGAAASQAMELQSTGILELVNAATLDNATSATELNITETNIQLTGAVDLEGGNVKINEDSGDFDFAIETDSTDNVFSIDSGNNTLETNGVTVTFNQGGADVDFIIESDDNAAAFVVDGGNDTVTVDTGLVVSFKTADPCTGAAFPEGSIFYNSTANVLCYCSASNADLKVADDSACF